MSDKGDFGSGKRLDDNWNSLQPQLNAVMDMLEDDRRKYWECRVDVPLVQSFLEKMEDFSKTILQGTEDLVSADAFDEPPDAFWRQWKEHFDGFEAFWAHYKDKLDRFAARKGLPSNAGDEMAREMAAESAAGQVEEPPSADLPVLRAVWEKLVIHYAHEAVDHLDVTGCAATRLLRLARYVVKVKPGKPTLQFLRRVSHCYVYGFDNECVILCRSAMDTGFREAVADEACSKYGEPGAGYGFTLVQRIKTALRSRIITADAEKAAHRVNMRGNKAVHDQPDITKDVLGTIKDTLLVLGQLSAAGRSKNTSS